MDLKESRRIFKALADETRLRLLKLLIYSELKRTGSLEGRRGSEDRCNKSHLEMNLILGDCITSFSQ